jgi:hypothetical protein
MIFRYPGGKERLAIKLLKDNTIPYADWNGESVSLKDLDNRTAAFWKMVIDSQVPPSKERLELFARQSREGWDSDGNEIQDDRERAA